jgi:hypothetical protein
VEAQIIYCLDEPEDQERFNRANKADALVATLQDMDMLLRNLVKYGGNEEFIDTELDTIDKLRTMFFQIMEERQVLDVVF